MAANYQEIAYSEGVRAIEEQQSSLENLRGRAGWLLVAASIVASFLGGSALAGPSLEHGKLTLPPIGIAGWFAIGFFVAIAAIAVAIVWPYRWDFAFNADTVLEGGRLLDGDVDTVHVWLAGTLIRNLRRNGRKMDWIVLGLRIQCLALLAETVLWIIDLRA